MSIAVVGEFVSRIASQNKHPFDDGVWAFFRAQMLNVGISPRECKWHTVINNPAATTAGLFTFLGTKAETYPGWRKVLRTNRDHYLRREYHPQVQALLAELRAQRPNLILAVGDLALWALTDEPNLMNARGRVTTGEALSHDFKILPLLSPMTVIREGQLLPSLFADLNKAKRESLFPDVRRPERFIHLHPTLEDLPLFEEEWMPEGSQISTDIETKGDTITCIGFAPSPSRAIVVPFYDETKPNGNYWSHAHEETKAWRWVKHILTSPKYTHFGQNFQYDVQYLLRKMGIPVPHWTDDTMLMHHALQPELRKGLGFLASIYSDELAWKFMRAKARDTQAKRGDDDA